MVSFLTKINLRKLFYLICMIIIIILVFIIIRKIFFIKEDMSPEKEEITCDIGDNNEKRICNTHPDIYNELINIYAPGIIKLRDLSPKEAAMIVTNTIGREKAKEWMNELRKDPKLKGLLKEIDSIELQYLLGEKKPPAPAEGFGYYDKERS